MPNEALVLVLWWLDLNIFIEIECWNSDVEYKMWVQIKFLRKHIIDFNEIMYSSYVFSNVARLTCVIKTMSQNFSSCIFLPKE